MPNTGQIALLIVAIALFAIGGVLSLLRLRSARPESLRIAAKACAYSAICVGVGVLVWHSLGREHWLPLDDNFDALTWLGLLLAIFVMYVQRHRPIGGLDWFVMPIVILLLVAAAVFGRTKPHEYLPSAWSIVHRITAYGGAISFAVAAAVGAMYLVANRRLRNKNVNALVGPNFGSLERLESLAQHAVTLGFALLTVGAVTGFVWMQSSGRAVTTPKLVLTVCVWIVYALVLHSPINPSFRGRKAAMLSIFGFVLMIGTLVAVQFMPRTVR